MKSFFIRHRYFLICQAVTLVIFFSFTILNEAGLNDGDSISHYFISRYSWPYPHLFLDNWGKPFFILLSSPFAQFGYHGIQVFNILCAVFSSWFCYRIACLLNIKIAFAAPLFLFMLPVYFIAIPSGLTEILFGLVLVISIFLLLKGHNIAGAILISFLPFCRSEGILILHVFGLILLLRKKIAVIPLLATGFVVYGIASYFYNGDFLWLVHTNPYHGVDVYGRGPLFYFVHVNDCIFGNLSGALFIAATTGYIIKRNFFSKSDSASALNFERIALWGSFAVYFVAHSIFWYKGLFGSAGMWRVMAAIAPVFALLSMRGLEWVSGLFIKIKWLYYPLFIAIFIFLILQPVLSLRLPQHLDERKATVQKACKWVKQNGLDTGTLYFSDPFCRLCLNLKPFYNTKATELMYVNRQNIGSDMPAGSIIIWDSGLGAHEDQIPLTKLQDTTKFKFLNKFEAPYEMDHGVKYAAYVFERK